MRKIRLSDTDLELFDIEISPFEYNFYQKHKDAFRTMWREQGTPFWTRFVITFRSFTVKHGVIKQMNIDSPKFQNLIDQAFIFIHEQFVDGSDKIAKNFIEDVARLAQHQDKLPALDSKSFAKDPFYARDTRELFRQFFGKPDQRSSYLKVYLLSPVFLRFGGSVCRCLVRWVDAPIQDDPKDDSYWTKPQDGETEKSVNAFCDESTMCEKCIDDSGTRFFKEKINGSYKGPQFLDCWHLGDPRFNDPENPLFAPHVNPDDDWRDQLTIEKFRGFLQYAKFKYIPEHLQCEDCTFLRQRKEKVIHVCRKKKKKKKKKASHEDLISDIKEVREKIDELEGMDIFTKEEYEKRVMDIIEKKPNVKEALKEVDLNGKENDTDTEDKKTKSSDTKTSSNSKDDKTISIFGSDAKITDNFEYGLFNEGENSSNKGVVAGFRVIKIEDEKNGLYEVNVSAAAIQEEGEEVKERKKARLYQQELNSFIFTAAFLVDKIEGLPKKFEWWEGRGFSIAVLDYEAEEREFVKKWTNFTLKVASFNEKTVKKIMVLLLKYIAKRKRRTCHGWNIEVDDIVTCILPEENIDITDLSISIQRGFRFEDRLMEEERDSLVKHQPNFCLTKVLMGLEAGEAFELLTEKGGKDKLKNMCKAIADFELYGNEDVGQLMMQLRNAEKNGKTREGILWDKLLANPDQFEFFCLVDKAKESKLWKTGVKTVDVRYYLSYKNPTTRICPICKVVDPKCDCYVGIEITSEAKHFMDTSKLEEVNDNDQNIPKMTYKEIDSVQLNGNENENCKKSKGSAKKKSKERKIELSCVPKKFLDVGIEADKTLISVPAKQDTELMGKVPINVDDKQDRMAPVPGLTSSLNLILQNGGKEQTIKVSLGAYMPEGKLNLIEEKKSQLKLENHRLTEILKTEEKKDDKKGKKDKSGKKKQVKESPEMTDSEKDTGLGLETAFLREILGRDEADKVAKQRNTHLGLSSKKQPVCPLHEHEKKGQEEEDMEKMKELFEHVEFIDDRDEGKDKIEVIEKKEIKQVNGKKKIDPMEIEEKKDVKKTVVYSAVPMDYKMTQKLCLLSQEMPNCSVLVVNNEKTGQAEVTVADADQVHELMGKREKSKKNKNKKTIAEKLEIKASSLKICSNCKKEEPCRKAFKKCQKCKEESLINTRYYCSRDCQMEDWQKKHKNEHKMKRMLNEDREQMKEESS